MNNQNDAIVTFTEDGQGGVRAEAATVIEFNEDLLTHRMADAVAEMHAEIGAKARGEFTDGERYRAFRALSILIALNSPLVDELGKALNEKDEDAPQNEAQTDARFDRLIVALNAKRDEILAQQEAAAKEARDATEPDGVGSDSVIIIPGPRKIRLVPETTLPEGGVL